jgi:hypothetical protein
LTISFFETLFATDVEEVRYSQNKLLTVYLQRMSPIANVVVLNELLKIGEEKLED